MPRKLFMDYYWHVKKSGAPFDREVIAAYKALEAAKVLMRSTAGIEVRADPVRLPEKKSSYTYESALAHLREVVMRGYGIGEDAWEAAADQALPYIDWRRQRSPEALLGIADAIQERTKK
jgi:hypothetical protein